MSNRIKLSIVLDDLDAEQFDVYIIVYIHTYIYILAPSQIVSDLLLA